MVDIHHGDVLDWLRSLPNESATALLSDPPYGLGAPPNMEKLLAHWLDGKEYHTGQGFMNKDWDVVPGPAVWREVMRVLKPGGVVAAFSGTRTVDLLGLAMRLAGLEIFDQFMWCYGCISEDTEVLTPEGWVRYHSAIATDQILCYDVGGDSFHWERPIHVYHYEYDDTAFRLEGDFTSQLVSRNHRCLVEREGALVFEFAEEAARESKIRVPVLEGLHALREAIADAQSNTSPTQPSVPQMWQPGPTDEIAFAGATGYGVGDVPDLRHGLLQASRVGETVGLPLLQPEVQWYGPWIGLGTTRSRGAGRLVGCESGGTSGADDGGNQPGVEGRGDATQPQGETWRATYQVRQVPAGVLNDGPPGWLRDGTPAAGGAGDWEATVTVGGGSSREPQRGRQPFGEPCAVSEQSGTQATRGTRIARTYLARITPEHYRGVMWCPSVSTGAFVARRAGMVFVTGNSGFPKSHDISKGIDDAAGAVRERIGRKLAADGGLVGREKGNDHNHEGWQRPWRDLPIEEQASVWVTAPATEDARTWDGYGTALKPAWEPCLLARKPRAASYAQTAVQHGTGALWIEGARIAVADTDVWTHSPGTTPKFKGNTWNNGEVYEGDFRDAVGRPSGRWPANLGLVHAEGCRYVGPTPMKGTDHGETANRNGRGGIWKPATNGPVAPGYSNADGIEIVDAWECVAGCPVREVGEQSGSNGGSKPGRGYEEEGTATRFFYQGVPDSTLLLAYNAKAGKAERNAGLDEFEVVAAGGMQGRHDGTFGDAPAVMPQNHHPTVKPIDVCRYLAQLLLPPEPYREAATLLIPFSGVCSEVIGAQWAGWLNVKACERDAEYIALGMARLKWWEGYMDKFPTVRDALEASRKGKGSKGSKGGRGGKKCDRPDELPLFALGT